MEVKLAQLKANLHQRDLLHRTIRFTGLYFSYKCKSFWPAFDLIASYFNMIIYLVIACLNFYWWFNLVHTLHMAVLAIFIISVITNTKNRRAAQ